MANIIFTVTPELAALAASLGMTPDKLLRAFVSDLCRMPDHAGPEACRAASRWLTHGVRARWEWPECFTGTDSGV